MSNDLKNKVDLDFIRYANCWEDVTILVRALQPLGKGKKFLSIASAGDNSLMLLTLDPALVVAADLNPVQIYLTELKIAAIRVLEREQVLQFLGFADCTQRLDFFMRIRSLLSNEAAIYWDQHLDLVEKGIVHQGKFEKYFRFFAKKILPWIHTSKRIDQLLAEKPTGGQKAFYRQHWNNRRWRFFFRIFFSRYIMGKYGRDPRFLQEVKVPVSTYVYQKAEKHLSCTAAQNNFMLHYQLKGCFESFLPPYLLEENFNLVKKNLDRIKLFHGEANEAVNVYGKFDGMNLSNIFEYMDQNTFELVATSLAGQLNENGIMCYWNLMVPRRISAVLPGKIHYQEKNSDELTNIDKGFFYSRFIVEQLTPIH